MKIHLIQKRKFEFNDKADGTKVNGFMYSGLTEDGPIEFSSMDGTLSPKVGVKYDPTKAIEIPIRIRIWDGKIKYQHDLIQNSVSGDWEVNPEHME